MKRKTNKVANKVISLILTLIMTVTMIPAFGGVAWAGTEEETVYDVDGSTYKTINDVLESATEQQYTIKLAKDTEETNTITIPEGKTVTIDINDKKLTLNSSEKTVMFDVKGTLIFTNCGNSQQHVTFNYQGTYDCYFAKVSGSLTLKKGVCLKVLWNEENTNSKYIVYMCENGSFVMEDGFIGDNLGNSVVDFGIYLDKKVASNGTLKLLGGTVSYCKTGVYTNKDITVGGTFKAGNNLAEKNIYLDGDALINISDEEPPQKGDMKIAVSLPTGKGNITSKTSYGNLRGMIQSETRFASKESVDGDKYDVYVTKDVTNDGTNDVTTYTYSLVDAVRTINFEKDPTLTYVDSNGKTKNWNSFNLLNDDCQIVAVREEIYSFFGRVDISSNRLILLRPNQGHAFNYSPNGTQIKYNGNIVGDCFESLDIEAIKTKYGFTDVKENDLVVALKINHIHGLDDTNEENDLTFQRLRLSGGTLSSGNYYLFGDLELNQNLVLAENAVVNLCLAGNKIVYNDYTVELNGGTFNIIEKCREEEEKKEKTPVIYFPYIPYTPLNTVTETEDNDKETTIEIPAGTKSDISDIEAEEASAKSTVSNLKIRANSKYVKSNGKRYIEVYSTVLSGKKKLAELKNLGYTVKYVVYRGTNEKNLKKIGESKTGKFTDKTGVNGKYYYYRIVLKIYNKEGKLIKSTKLGQCKYGSRMYNTNGLVH